MDKYNKAVQGSYDYPAPIVFEKTVACCNYCLEPLGDLSLSFGYNGKHGETWSVVECANCGGLNQDDVDWE